MIIDGVMRALLAGSALLLAACATNMHPVGMTMSSGQVLSGALNIGGGAQDVTLTSDDGQLACNGVSLLEYATPGCRTSGSLRLQCTDGRDVSGNWKMNDCTSGQGSGADSLGNAVTFHIGAGPVKTGTTLEPSAVPAPRAAHPVIEAVAGSHLFRFGGDYAAGFGEASQFAYEAVFTDAESGLIIVRLDATDDLPMSLADVSLTSGQEAFVVMPDSARIERILVAGESPDWKTGNDVSLPSGLPVMNLAGEVVALTNGARLVDAHSLRRYLQLLAPSLATKPATHATVEQLRERIMTRHAD